ncbi:peptidoglycan-binding protein [Methylobrevis albus]|uniref:SEL1-like repeat protein n=1 Tax=Methylobrevis albus TaxID=2793297 RepID=A0A931MXX9_9HYPH|nr:peptidoglycan-binding protein [Methylobrevis albus]MBH0237445.1 SEL1-like repeat protein [Methylobrevis albus]
MTSRSAPRQDTVAGDIRREAERAAAAAGLTVDEWLTRLIRSNAGDAPGAQPAPQAAARPAAKAEAPVAPAPAQAPAQAAAAGPDGQPIGRIIDSLDRLGDRIRALSTNDRGARQPHLAAVADNRSRDLQKAIEEITAQRDQIERAAAERRRAAPPHLQPVPSPAPLRAEAPRPEPVRPEPVRSEPVRAEASRSARPEAPRAEAPRAEAPRAPAPRAEPAPEARPVAAAAPAPVAAPPAVDTAAFDRLAARLDARIDGLTAAIPPREHFEIVREEISRLRDAVAANATKPALAGLTRSYDLLVERLDAVGGREPDSGLVTELVGQMAEVRDLLAAIPGESHHRLLTARLDELAARVEAIAAAPGDQGVAVLEGQLAQLARAVAGLDPSRLVTSVESRLDTVASRLNQIEGQMSRLDVLPQVARRLETQGERLEDLGRRFDALPQLLREIDARLAPVEALPGALAQDIETLKLDVRGDLAELSDRLGPVEALPETLSRDLDAMKQDVRIDIAALAQRFAPVEALPATIARDIDGVREDIGTLAQRLAPIENLPHAVAREVDAVRRDVREDIGAVLARIDDMGERLAGLDVSAIDAGVVAALDGRFTELAAQIDGLGDDADSEMLAALELRIAALAERMETRLSAIDRSTGAAFEALGRQIDTRAMAGDPGTGLQLAELGRKLDSLANQPLAGLDGGALAGIEVRLEEIGARIGSIEAVHGGPLGGAPSADLADAIGRIEDAITALADHAGAARPDEMAEVARAIDGLRRDLADLASPSLDGLEAEIRQIAGRLDMLAAGGPAPATLGAEIEARIERLVDRIDSQSRDDDRLAAALRSVEQTIATALDTGDMAQAAARAAVAAFDEREGSAVAGAIRGLGRDLENLQREIQESRQRDLTLLDSMNDILQSVSGLSGLSSLAAAPSRAVAAPAPAPRVADEETWREIERSLAAGLAGAQPPPQPSRPAAAAPGPSILDDLIAPRQGAGRKAPPSAEAPLDLGEAGDSFDADLPLEPGSGKPRVARPAGGTPQVRAERRTPTPPAPQPEPAPAAAPAPAHGKTDFIAAARRAAQQAASEQAAVVTPPAAPVAEEPKAERAGLRGFLAAHRRQILMAAAALVLTLGVVRVVGWTLGDDRIGGPATAATEATTSEAADAPAPANTAEVTPPAAETDDEPGFDIVAAPEATGGNAASFGPNATSLPAGSFAPPAAPPTTTPADVEADAAATTADAEPATGPAVAQDAAPETVSLGTAATEPGTPDADPARIAAPLPPAAIGAPALREAAAAGDPAAQFEVAARLVEGRGIVQDVAGAAVWYERAAEAGLAPAQYRLGSLYEKGQGVPRDAKRAAAWYERAAEAGNAKAMHNLAVMHTEGSLGDPDYTTAAEWFTAAADLGVRDSQYNLGILHARGLGVTRDLASSYKWFAIAGAAGDADAAKKREDIEQALDSDSLARARLAVETWKPKPLSAAANEVEIANPAWMLPPASVAASDGDLIARAQALLAAQGFSPGPADGKMGRRTRDAIVAFQKQRGLPETGVADAALVAALAERAI